MMSWLLGESRGGVGRAAPLFWHGVSLLRCGDGRGRMAGTRLMVGWQDCATRRLSFLQQKTRRAAAHVRMPLAWPSLSSGVNASAAPHESAAFTHSLKRGGRGDADAAPPSRAKPPARAAASEGKAQVSSVRQMRSERCCSCYARPGATPTGPQHETPPATTHARPAPPRGTAPNHAHHGASSHATSPSLTKRRPPSDPSVATTSTGAKSSRTAHPTPCAPHPQRSPRGCLRACCWRCPGARGCCLPARGWGCPPPLTPAPRAPPPR